MGLKKSPALAQTGPPDLDKIPPVGRFNRIFNKHHHLYRSDSHTMVQRMCVWYQRVQLQRPGMALVHTTIIPWHVHALSPIIIGVKNVNLPHYPKIRTRESHPSLHESFRHPGMYVQGILLPHQRVTTQHSHKMVGMVPRQHRLVTTFPTHQRDLKHHSRLAI